MVLVVLVVQYVQVRIMSAPLLISAPCPYNCLWIISDRVSGRTISCGSWAPEITTQNNCTRNEGTAIYALQFIQHCYICNSTRRVRCQGQNRYLSITRPTHGLTARSLGHATTLCLLYVPRRVPLHVPAHVPLLPVRYDEPYSHQQTSFGSDLSTIALSGLALSPAFLPPFPFPPPTIETGLA